MLGHVSQHSLRRSRLRLGDRPLDGAALFPFFDEAGRTRAVMLLDGQSRRIVLADWTPHLFERRWARRHSLRLRFADLRDADASDAERLGDLWHFDPWWVLGQERYAGHDALPALMRTNVPGYDEAVKRVWFDRTLGRVSYVAAGTADAPNTQVPARTVGAAALDRLGGRRPDAVQAVRGLRLIDIRRAGPDAFMARARTRRDDVRARGVQTGSSRTGWRLRPFWLSANTR